MTFKDIDTVHERPEGTARHRFAENKKHFVEGTDYFVITPKILENAELDGKRPIGIESVSQRGTAFITETGYLMLVKSFTDDLAWDVQRDLVNTYFRAKEIVNTELSPELQMIQKMVEWMAKMELSNKELNKQSELMKEQIAQTKETVDKTAKTTENIKEAVRPVIDDWRPTINSKFNRIQKNAERGFDSLRTEMYSELEKRAGCDLGARLRNKRKRMTDNGRTKSEINNLNKMDIIEEDKKLREIFSKIVTEYEIKYCT